MPDTVNSVNDEMQLVVFASDEIFEKTQPILITVEPISSAIFRIVRIHERHRIMQRKKGFVAGSYSSDRYISRNSPSSRPLGDTS